MELADRIKGFIGSIDEKFADEECNLSYNKLEFIALVQRTEEHFGIEIADDVLNQIVTTKDLTDEVCKLL
jgi:acyl carrier protein